MSPSWIKPWLKPFSVRPEAEVGIAIGSRSVCAVMLVGEPGDRRMAALAMRELATPLFAGPPASADEERLVEALTAVSGSFRNLFAEVRVALPDTAIRSAVFELDELPKTEALRSALLRWRFAKEWQRSEESLECHGTHLGEEDGKWLFFGQAGDRAWLDCIKRALSRSGIVPWSLNAASVCRFNCFHDEITAGSGALLALDADCWNIQIWDAAGRVRRVLTRLRTGGDAEHDSLLNAVERAILAYVHEAGGRTVERVFITADEVEASRVVEALNGRLREGAVWLRPDAKITGIAAGVGAGMATLALAAALGGD